MPAFINFRMGKLTAAAVLTFRCLVSKTLCSSFLNAELFNRPYTTKLEAIESGLKMLRWRRFFCSEIVATWKFQAVPNPKTLKCWYTSEEDILIPKKDINLYFKEQRSLNSQTIHYKVDSYFLNVICIALSTACINGAEAVKINVWLSAAEKWKFECDKSFKQLWQLLPCRS